MIAKPEKNKVEKKVRGNELKALGFIIIVLFPMLSIFSVGAYGFIIWMMQAFGPMTGH